MVDTVVWVVGKVPAPASINIGIIAFPLRRSAGGCSKGRGAGGQDGKEVRPGGQPQPGSCPCDLSQCSWGSELCRLSVQAK